MLQVIISKTGERPRIATVGEGRFVIGRKDDNDIVLAAPGVSTRHAELLVSTHTVTITDLGSRNGTFISGECIEGSKTLNHGDRVQVFPYELEFKLDAPPPRAPAGDSAARLSHSPEPEDSPPPDPMKARASAPPTLIDLDEQSWSAPEPATSDSAPSNIKESIEPDDLSPSIGDNQLANTPATPICLSDDADPLASGSSPRAQANGDIKGRNPAAPTPDSREWAERRPAHPESEPPPATNPYYVMSHTATDAMASLEAGATDGDRELLAIGGFLVEPGVRELGAEISDEDVGLASTRLLGCQPTPRQPILHGRTRDGRPIVVVGDEISSRGPCLRISPALPAFELTSLDRLVASSCLSADIARILTSAINQQCVVAVCSTGLSTRWPLISALGWLEHDTNCRVLVHDESYTPPGHPHTVCLRATAASPNTIVETASAFAPSLVIAPTVDASHGQSLLTAAAAAEWGLLIGAKGASAEQAVAHLAALVSMGARPTDFATSYAQVASVLDYVVIVAQLPDGQSRVLQVAEVNLGPDATQRIEDLYRYCGEHDLGR